jgi:hypothetical protein
MRGLFRKPSPGSSCKLPNRKAGTVSGPSPSSPSQFVTIPNWHNMAEVVDLGFLDIVVHGGKGPR